MGQKACKPDIAMKLNRIETDNGVPKSNILFSDPTTPNARENGLLWCSLLIHWGRGETWLA